MRIYTSYFANIDNLKKADIYCVAMCLKVPSFFNGPNIQSVAPTASILTEHKNNHDDEQYKKRYINEVLCIYRFHPEYLINLLKNMSEGKDVALLCYERPEDFCHRHIFAEWFNEKIPGLNIEEYPIYPEKKVSEKKKNDTLVCNALF